MPEMDREFWDRALFAAQSSAIAYMDGAAGQKFFAEHGYHTHAYLDIDGAQAHMAASDDACVFAFRGTQPQQINDIMADLDTIPKRHGKGWVHGGFRREARKLIKRVFEFAEENRGKRFLMTGHSLGAAMATYTAQELEWAHHENMELFTFGSPRVGNADYVDSIRAPHWRFVNNNDGVTHVPPRAMMFKHHGTLMYINHYGFIRQLSRWQRFKDQVRGHWAAVRKLQPFDWLYDHKMALYLDKIRLNAKSDE